ncbi:hypothetical protein [Sorangium sp. So ce385]|uniref:hypothetical protein n=1 Tax=Sorangium sp. So ce385 TaxID=3133308 RepID=UPI003F5ADF29
MSTSSGWQDPLGRPQASIARVLIAVLAALAITGSAWPTQARSMRPSYDTGGKPSRGSFNGILSLSAATPVPLARGPALRYASPPTKFS